MSDAVSIPEALIYAMVTMSAVDSSIDDTEMRKIGNIVQTLPAFSDFDAESLVSIAEACGEVMSGDDGLQDVLDVIAESLPPRLYATAYALAVDVAAANMEVAQEELRFLQLLRDRLDLDKLTIAAIERGARARHAV